MVDNPIFDEGQNSFYKLFDSKNSWYYHRQSENGLLCKSPLFEIIIKIIMFSYNTWFDSVLNWTFPLLFDKIDDVKFHFQFARVSGNINIFLRFHCDLFFCCIPFRYYWYLKFKTNLKFYFQRVIMYIIKKNFVTLIVWNIFGSSVKAFQI